MVNTLVVTLTHPSCCHTHKQRDCMGLDTSKGRTIELLDTNKGRIVELLDNNTGKTVELLDTRTVELWLQALTVCDEVA